MFDFNKMYDTVEVSTTSQIITQNGLISDLKQQIDDYLNHLKLQNKSDNTLRSYNFTLTALIEFSSVYLDKKSSILVFQDYEIVNSFFDWISNYKLHSEHGTLKERMLILSKFLKKYLPDTQEDLLLHLQDQLEKSRSKYDYRKTLYAIESFSEFLDLKKVDNIKGQSSSFFIEFKEYRELAEVGSSQKTMQLRKAVITSFFSYLEKKSRGEIRFSDSYSFYQSFKASKTLIKRTKPFSDDEAAKIAKYLYSYPEQYIELLKNNRTDSEYVAYRNSLIILVMFYGGCRISEVLNLKFSDIEEVDDLYEIIVTGKGSKKRKVFVKSELIQKHLSYIKTKEKSDYVAATSTDSVVKYEYIKSFANDMFKELGINQSGVHVFRHYFASNFAEKNGNIIILKDLLGHESIETTEIYSNIGERSVADAVRGV